MLIPTYFGKLQHFLSAVESAKSGIDSFIVELRIMPISIILRFDVSASASALAFIVNKTDI